MRLSALLLLALLLILAGPVCAAPGGPAGGDFREYAGTIGDLRIAMTLDKSGAKLSGEYRYAAQQSWLKLRGEMTGDRDFILEEFAPPPPGRDAGAGSNITSAPRISRFGTSTPRASISRYTPPAAPTPAGWGPERALFAGDAAVYQSKQGETLTFRLQGDELIIAQKGDLGAALGVSYNGEYRRGKVELTPPTLTHHGVFTDPAAEEAFKALVGGAYGEFLKYFHIVYKEKDLDQIGATVYRGGVRACSPPWKASSCTPPKAKCGPRS